MALDLWKRTKVYLYRESDNQAIAWGIADEIIPPVDGVEGTEVNFRDQNGKTQFLIVTDDWQVLNRPGCKLRRE